MDIQIFSSSHHKALVFEGHEMIHMHFYQTNPSTKHYQHSFICTNLENLSHVPYFGVFKLFKGQNQCATIARGCSGNAYNVFIKYHITFVQYYLLKYQCFIRVSYKFKTKKNQFFKDISDI